MKISYVLLFDNTEGKTIKLTVNKGDPEVAEPDVLACLVKIADADAFSEKSGRVAAARGYDRVNVMTKEFAVS